MTKIKVLSPFEERLVRSDLSAREGFIAGTVYLNDNFEFCPIYAYRYGYPISLVDKSLKEYDYSNISFGSKIDDCSLMVDFSVKADLRGVFSQVVLNIVKAEENQKGGYTAEQIPLSTFINTDIIETSVKSLILNTVEELDDPYDFFNVINRRIS